MGAITIKDAINRAPTTTKPKFDFPTFGVVENGVMVLNDSGKIVQKIWNEMPKYYSSVELGEFIVMPDHIHGIIEINNDANRRGAIYRVQPCVQQPRIQPPSCGTGGFAADKNPMFHNNLARIIRWFKGRITFECHKINCDFKWQRNYYEHIIRDEAGYARIAKYIRNNPILWGRKRLNDILPQI
jgi:REP element-mobilizing transposase RayT